MKFFRRGRKAAQTTEDNAAPVVDKRGFLRWPGKVIPRPIKDTHRNALKMTVAAFSADRPDCPDCRREGRAGVLLPVAGRPNARRCSDPDCGMEITLRELADINGPAIHYAPEARRAYFLRSANIMFVVACVVLSGAVLYSGWMGSGLMMFAAFLLSMPLFMGCFAMRYRAWQVAENRFYEEKAPLGDFIQAELASIFKKQS
ncbi:hypothetical protein [Rhizobium sp. CECT 9324]|jgi:hypothetical protein|uniref:hypothetical protein n=1 Tax=Rhizobium sp. CECT 9324 TaxID=2845820 RepID=UPI001E57D38F|nr:hypothetical protein [Rhizobium sp. CECT 9324]CAH0343634.1 hypothetical protein RHI9324_05371 [Rhizobium sp. CECT 9324]